jgi:hypothetical protein
MDFKEEDWVCGLDSSDSWQGPIAGCSEHGNKTFVSIKGEEFIG